MLNNCAGAALSADDILRALDADPNLQRLLGASAVDFCVLGEGELAFTRIVAGEPLAPFVDGGTVDFSGRTSRTSRSLC